MLKKKHVFWNHPLLSFCWIISIHRIYNKCEHKTLKMSSVFYFSVGQPPRCKAGNPLASTRPQKFTTSACIITSQRQKSFSRKNDQTKSCSINNFQVSIEDVCQRNQDIIFLSILKWIWWPWSQLPLTSSKGFSSVASESSGLLETFW